jgi:hypothetical protein
MRTTVMLVSLVCLSGCASIVSGRDTPIPINSVPDGAAFTVVDENGTVTHKGVTPASVTLPRSGGYFNGRDYAITSRRRATTPPKPICGPIPAPGTLSAISASAA